MLIVSRAQMTAFQDASRLDFERRMKEKLPAGDQSDAQLKAAIQEAEALGFVTEDQAARFVMATWQEDGTRRPVAPQAKKAVYSEAPAEERLQSLERCEAQLESSSDSEFSKLPIGQVVKPCPLREPPDHWIEIELLDEDGEPVPYEPYRIKLTDGTERQDKLDEKGWARYDHIPAGTCYVGFPSLSGLAWEGLPTVGPDEDEEDLVPLLLPPITPRGWIEIVMLDANGDPVEGEPYILKLPDGALKPGTTDEDGEAGYDEIAQGQCEISFPESGDWELVSSEG